MLLKGNKGNLGVLKTCGGSAKARDEKRREAESRAEQSRAGRLYHIIF